MSETGVLILTSTEEQPGAVATLKFQAFEAAAEIVWTGATGENVRLGMRFVFVEPKGREFMRGFSEYLRGQGYPR